MSRIVSRLCYVDYIKQAHLAKGHTMFIDCSYIGPDTNSTMTMVETTKNSLYCPYCDTVVETTIHCGEYKLMTIAEAIADGMIEAL